ncbi:MAG: DNA mismatch repair endonuclease MutL [bacterium]
MPDQINLLPPHIANQIAAGEVVQRPASAVKELLENAVDAGATEIRLVITEAGKSSVQVIDNGKGMTETDARNCFERHATSKISTIEDLFSIRTMGFRGEALASIASVAQVIMKTRRPDDELGTEIEIENSKVLRQEPCSCPVGTSITMKNLFFNVPARRNFLKSNVVEQRHITDEFIRVALAFPEIFFSFTNNGQEVFHLEKGSLKQRIVQLMGSSYSTKLVQVDEKTDYLDIKGFIGKPDTAKKTRGDQYLFVNNRFVKSAYLNHAVVSAYEALIPDGSFPFFAIFLDIDPVHLDINVHPTKQEIKFEDDKIVYAFVKSAIRHALAQFSIAPAIDFGLDASIQQLDAVSKPFTHSKQDETRSGGLFKSFVDQHQAHRIESSSNLKDWKDFFETNPQQKSEQQSTLSAFNADGQFNTPTNSALHLDEGGTIAQFNLTYIVFEQQKGFTLLHQQLAHQQILFEQFNTAWEGKGIAVQQNLFPVAINISPADMQVVEQLLPDLLKMGYQLEPFGPNTYLLQGSPADYPSDNDLSVIEMIIEDVKDASSSLHRSYQEKISKTLARKHAIKAGKKLTADEMIDLVHKLSKCKQSSTHFDGKPLFVEVKKDYLNGVFGL